MVRARLPGRLRAESAATGLPLGLLLAIAVGVHVAVAFLAVNPWHPDEHFQILEFAWARAGLSPLDALPWEWEARIRPTLQPAMALGVLEVMRALGAETPYPWMLTLRLGTLALAWAVMIRVLLHAAEGLSRPARQALWLSGILLWFSPLLLFRFTSENLGGLALAATFPLLTREARGHGPDVVFGGLLGISFLFRFQMGFAALPLLAWLAWRGEHGARRASVAALAGLAVVGGGALLDAWFYGAWVFTPWQYLHANVVEGVASTFGVSPWYAYLAWIPLWMAPPLGFVVAALAALGLMARPSAPWSWAVVGFLLGHTFVPHKELRFLFPLLYLLPVLLAWGVHDLRRRVADARWARWATGVLVAQNMILLALLVTPAIHRGREVDVHYLQWLWAQAEQHPGDTVYVMTPTGDPYLIHGLEANVYRHPRVVGVPHRGGDAVPSRIPPDTPASRRLLMIKDTPIPGVAGADLLPAVYRAEAGYRALTRASGMGEPGWLTRVEAWDRWSTREGARTVHPISVRRSAGPGVP